MQRLSLTHFLVVLLICVGCGNQEEADPWAESERSRDASSLKPIPLVEDGFLGKIGEALNSPSLNGEPNLYDLHHPEGALATYGRSDPVRAVKLAQAGGIPVELDRESGSTRFQGEPRQLWLNMDRTIINLPQTHHREGFRSNPGIIVLQLNGRVRICGTAKRSSPAPSIDEAVKGAAYWVAGWSPEPPPERPKAEALSKDQTLALTIQSNGTLKVGKHEVTLDQLAMTVRTSLADSPQPIFIDPEPQSHYQDLVQVLDRLHDVADQGFSVRIVLPHSKMSDDGSTVGLVRKLRPTPSADPPMVLKIEQGVSFHDVQVLFDGLANHLDRVILLTQLDISDPSRITESTWPGVFPGGLELALPKPTPDQRVVAEPIYIESNE